MRSAGIEERLREHIANDAAQVPVPPQVAIRILRAVEASRPRPVRPRKGMLQFAAGMAFVLLLVAGVVWMRTAQMSAAIVNGSWSSAPAMAAGRGYQTATLLPNGKVLVVAGSQTIRILASAELYDPRTRTWSSAGALRTPRSLQTATLLRNGKVLVVGGSEVQPYYLGSLASAELYDPQSNTWASAASMHTARSSHTATLLADGRVLVIGGIEASNDVTGSVLATAELYDPVTNTWSWTAPMPVGRARHVAILLADHRVLVVGGTGSPGAVFSGYLRTAEIYDPAAQSWSSAADMSFARFYATGTLLPDGRVLVVGDDGVNERTAETFDPGSDRWLPVPDPGVGRAEHVAVGLRNGMVLVAGGVGETSAELFDWRRDVWLNAGALSVIRASATATVLDTGQVLIVGGFGTRSIPWASAELFDPRGTSLVGVRSSRPAAPSRALEAFLVCVLALLLSLALWIRRGRRWRGDEAWVE